MELHWENDQTGGLAIVDGRHRLAALGILGATHVWCCSPQSSGRLLIKWLGSRDDQSFEISRESVRRVAGLTTFLHPTNRDQRLDIVV